MNACRMRNAPNPVARNGIAERTVGVEPHEPADERDVTQGDNRLEVREEHDLERHHHRREEEHEDRALEREVEERERVAGEDRGDDLPGDDEERDDETVEEIRPHVPLRPRLRVAAPQCVGREERRRPRRDLVRGEQRVHDRDVDREQHDERQHAEEHVAVDDAGPAGDRGPGERADESEHDRSGEDHADDDDEPLEAGSELSAHSSRAVRGTAAARA